jgi:hypothetical protein
VHRHHQCERYTSLLTEHVEQFPEGRQLTAELFVVEHGDGFLLVQLRPLLVQLRPLLVQLRPLLVQLRPLLVQLRPLLVRLRPLLVRLRPRTGLWPVAPTPRVAELDLAQ